MNVGKSFAGGLSQLSERQFGKKIKVIARFGEVERVKRPMN